ncbi:MAG: tRNA lysidine(34) synthetase TilS [Solobacterium sp.]|nr:tRNA lysidine(34) synthetase TilS [Solobacterium sp.]
MNKDELNRGTWLAAVSGGPDSMALLGMCISAGIHVAAAHVNYHHRPQAEQEEAWVREYCAEHGIVCHVRNEAFHSTGNFEADARKWRYEFFVSLVREYGYAGVLVAHQEDDLIETYLMQEEKGIIPAYYGLQEAMMYGGVQVRRPLLDHTKQGLQDYCERNGIRYWLDETNASDLYTRNRIRHETVEPMDAFMRRMIRREIDEKNARLHE